MDSISEIIFITGLVLLLVVATISIITLVISFKKENRICCIGGGVVLALVSSILGFFALSGSFILDEEFSEILTLITMIILFIFAIFASIFTLLSVIKKKEFCCLGGGISLAGIGYGASITFIASGSSGSEEFVITLLILWVIILLTVSITALLVILLSLKKRQSLCCFAGAIALAGVVLGFGAFTLVIDELFGVTTLITNILLLVLSGVFVPLVNKSINN
ncbi:hypothetical protein WAK64_19710 [Bacillus spongiae]|uniref:DUF4203 domain-containing protein n=1 Tax=Bacillus spongiae TaxID=2683610 RepID=A0ABU8HJE4_9BACI